MEQDALPGVYQKVPLGTGIFFCATFADGGLSDLGAPESRLDDPPLGISLIVTIGGTRG